MNTLKNLSLTLIALVMLLGMALATINPAAAATVPNCTQWHVVKGGDTLTKIAQQYNTTVSKLVEINEIANPNLIYVGQSLCVTVSGASNGSNNPTPAPTLPNTGTGVRVFAASVKEDLSVSLSGKYLVANSTYTIYLSNMKAKTAVSYSVGTVTTKSDGTFSGTFNLPGKLADVSKIKVLLNNGKGDLTSNWFYNLTTSGNTGGIGSPVLTLTVVKIDEGESIKIQVSNLLPGVKYEVLMNKTGTAGVGGTLVDTIKSSDGKTVTATFEIPSDLENRSKLDLRVENGSYESFAYLTFDND